MVVGTGWAGATLSTALDERKYKVTVVSPEETTPYTPLLASAACGLYDFGYVQSILFPAEFNLINKQYCRNSHPPSDFRFALHQSTGTRCGLFVKNLQMHSCFRRTARDIP